ncbi:putative ATP-dependent RNA helicase SoYb [Drosophila virilis]|uniref:RNA helicase n=1 Tax=Drosophila virilis TaxID=7244 RepID=B4M286_DROVI|nr:putative ATP-dependent RNA helicase SoYb [Drosophila virilis]EDW65790.2 uncharacterized protein Dvir_GJ18700 [Drosophila virilis]
MIHNTSLGKQTVSGAGRGNLDRALRLYFHADNDPNQYFEQSPVTQGAAKLCRSAALSALVDATGNRNGNEQIAKHVCDDVEFNYLTPSSKRAALDLLAVIFKNEDLNVVRFLVICEQADEAADWMQELGRRSVGCLLLNEPKNLIDCVRLWTDGSLNSVLVVCDLVLELLVQCSSLRVNYLIHSTQPLPHVFKKRLDALIPMPRKGIQVLILRCPAANQLQYTAAERVPPKATASNGRASTSLSELSAIATTKKLSPMLNKEYSVEDALPGSDAILQTMLSPTPSDTSTSSDAFDSAIKSLSLQPGEEQFDTATGCVHTYNNFGIFAWSRSEQISCFNISEVAAIGPTIKAAMQVLNIGHVRAKSVQRFAWTHVAAGRSMCAIGNESIGKTWCYLPTLCQRNIQESKHRRFDGTDYGPSSIILCANAQQGEQIGKWCLDLMGMQRDDMEHVIRIFKRISANEVAQRLARPCGILITTVEQLEHIYQLHTKLAPIFNPLVLRCLAFDGIDIMWRNSRIPCEKVTQWLFNVLRFEEGHAQLFVVGRLWIEQFMGRVLPKLPDVLLLFEDALEATVFNGLKLEMLTAKAHQHDQDILALLQNKKLDELRVVLACQGKPDASKLSKQLSDANIRNIIIDKQDRCSGIAYAEWTNKRNACVLITIDDVVPKLRGGCIDCLIHYDYNNWPRFKARFSLFYGNYKTQTKTSNTATSIMYVGLGDVEQTWLICDFMLKHNRSPPDSYMSMLTEYRMNCELDQPRSNLPLCRHLMAYGNCYRHTCQYRHILWDFETVPPDHHPKRGDIEFHVLASVTPAQTAAKLTKDKIAKYFFNMPVTKLGESIQLHYENPLNRQVHLDPKVGDICVLKLNKLYQRVGVTRINTADHFDVRQLDAGIEFSLIHKSELLVCDEKFKDESFEAYDLRITSLAPFNMERIWPEDAKRLVRRKFFNRPLGKPCRTFTAKVDFAFHEIIFVENVYDEAGNDLKSFVLKNIPVLLDKDVKTRLQKVISTAKPFR